MTARQAFASAIKSVVKQYGCTVEDTRMWLDAELESLAERGAVAYRDDARLGGVPLEIRVRNIFRDLGFSVRTSHDSSFDALLQAPEGVEPSIPVVVEVKGGKSKSPSREDLRQLDDWVYELSGEERFRKRRLGLRFGGAWITNRIPFQGATGVGYPPACKGAFIYNCTTGAHFASEGRDWLGDNEAEFCHKRDFVVLSLRCLLAWDNAVKAGQETAEALWHAFHETEGILADPA